MRLLPPMLKGHWHYVAMLFALALFTAILEGIGLSLVIPLTQTMVSTSEAASGGGSVQRAFSSIATLIPEQWRLVGLLGLLSLVFLIKSIGLVASSGLSRWFVDVLRMRWVAGVFLSYTRMPYSEVSVRPHGEVVQTIFGETELAARSILLLIELAVRCIQVLVLLLVLFLTNWQATVFVLLLGVLGFGLSWRTTQVFSLDIGKKKQSLRLRSNDIVTEGITGLRTLKLLDIAELRVKRVRGMLRDFARLNTRFTVISQLPSNTIDLVGVVAGAIVVLFMTKALDMRTEDVLPTTALFGLVFLRMAGSASYLFSKRLQIANSLPPLRSVYKVLTAAPEQMPGSNPFPGIRRGIVFQDIVVQPPGRPIIFDRLGMTIAQVGLTAIVGASGSGKTTLVDLIVRLREPDSGRILIDGRDIREFDVRSLRRRVGFLSQDTQLFNGTVAENIRLGRLDATDAEVRAAAQRAHVHDFVSSMPQGYDTPLGRDAVTLSGGQRQRLALARELLRNPDLYIFDEPTSALDQEAEAAIGGLINELSKTHPVIVVSHRLDIIFGATAIYRLEQGKAAESTLYQLAKVSEPVKGL
jgi:ATP-binding cassette, subfamily B, bacterial MsbA